MSDSDWSHYRVLIVDDDTVFLSLCAEVLRVERFDVITAASYLDAVEILDRPERIDLILTDVMMTFGNGFQLSRVARMRHPQITIVYLTGLDVSPIEAIGPVLRKPVTNRELIDAVKQALLRKDR